MKYIYWIKSKGKDFGGWYSLKNAKQARLCLKEKHPTLRLRIIKLKK